jgi:hypothetical protein
MADKVKVKTNGNDFARLECGRVLLEMSKDGDSPNCPRSWTWDMWFDGEHIDGTCEEASLHMTVKDAIESLDGIIADFEGMRDYLRAYEVFGRGPEEGE